MRYISSTKWIVRPKPTSDRPIRLLCFPHAGGGASAFNDWPNELPNQVEVCAIEPPGRGRRLLETPLADINRIIESVLDELLPLENTRLALLGHSVGALVAFEFARRLRRLGIHPLHLFVSGHNAPHLPDPEPPICHLPDPAFVREVRQRYDGIPHEILNDSEVLELILPALRADCMLEETYRYRDEPLLDCPISSFGGLQDHSTSEGELAAWRNHTTGTFKLHMFPGAHFFIRDQRDRLLQAVAHDLQNCLATTEAL